MPSPPMSPLTSAVSLVSDLALFSCAKICMMHFFFCSTKGVLYFFPTRNHYIMQLIQIFLTLFTSYLVHTILKSYQFKHLTTLQALPFHPQHSSEVRALLSSRHGYEKLESLPELCPGQDFSLVHLCFYATDEITEERLNTLCLPPPPIFVKFILLGGS